LGLHAFIGGHVFCDERVVPSFELGAFERWRVSSLARGRAFAKRWKEDVAVAVDDRLHTELWISWASLLRSYAAAHGLNSKQFAVIEFGEGEIVVRASSKWVRFTHNEIESSDGCKTSFALTEDGRVMLDGKMDEMDFAAERITRELMQ
jgi:hypothetical protein